MDVSENVPDVVLLHVPPGVVWNGLYSKPKNLIQDLDKMMIYYSVKPYHMIELEYIGGPNFNVKIYNPYGVEVNYLVAENAESSEAVDRDFFNFSEIELDRLYGIMSSNVYRSGSALYDLPIRKSHLRKKDYIKV